MIRFHSELSRVLITAAACLCAFPHFLSADMKPTDAGQDVAERVQRELGMYATQDFEAVCEWHFHQLEQPGKRA